MAPGYALDSASSGTSDCSTKEPAYLKAGTSMATPVVAGAAALVRQYFQEGWYPCGSKGCGDVIDPSGSLVKAVLANGAQLLKGVQVGGTTTVIANQSTKPYDHTQNMGVANLLTSLPLPNENAFNIFVQNDIAGSLSFDFDINQSGCRADFQATLAWYDPPAANGCTKCLVNDLDLLVENVQSSKMYYPNGASSADTLNNIERVRIANTASGEKFRVSVNPKQLGPGYTEQRFSLVVTGCFGQSRSVDINPPKASAQRSYELAMTYKADRKQAGNIFSIEAKTDGVEVNSFAIHTLLSGTKAKMHVYTLIKAGGIDGEEAFLSDPLSWTMISPTDGIEVDTKGFGSSTIIPVGSFDAVPIKKGEVQSFYITFVDETEMLYKATDDDYPTGASYISDDNIEIFTGVGKGLNFGVSWQSRQMNGAVFYSIADSQDAEVSKTTTPPTKRPSGVSLAFLFCCYFTLVLESYLTLCCLYRNHRNVLQRDHPTGHPNDQHLDLSALACQYQSLQFLLSRYSWSSRQPTWQIKSKLGICGMCTRRRLWSYHRSRFIHSLQAQYHCKYLLLMVHGKAMTRTLPNGTSSAQ